MFPIDEEFIALYLIYGLMIVYLLKGLFSSAKMNSFYKVNTAIFLFYFLIMVVTFVDEESFKYGGSLTVLFSGFVFVIVHFIGIFIYKAVNRLAK